MQLVDMKWHVTSDRSVIWHMAWQLCWSKPCNHGFVFLWRVLTVNFRVNLSSQLVAALILPLLVPTKTRWFESANLECLENEKYTENKNYEKQEKYTEINTKFKLYEAVVMLILLYSAKLWLLTSTQLKKLELECGTMPNVMATLPNIGRALCQSSLIPFLVRPAKFSWCTLRMPCSNAANTGERKTWTQSKFCTWKNSIRGEEPPKMYT